MAGSTTKKAVIRRFDREPLAGYINPASYLQLTGIELLSEQGNVATVPYEEIKTVSFVREFDGTDDTARRVFNTRPKMEGLWVRMHFRDGDAMDKVRMAVGELFEKNPAVVGLLAAVTVPNSRNDLLAHIIAMTRK